MGESIVAELKNYATNYYTSGNGEIDLAGALEQLRGRKKSWKMRSVWKWLKSKKREKLEQEYLLSGVMYIIWKKNWNV